jgi:hypothetical protein
MLRAGNFGDCVSGTVDYADGVSETDVTQFSWRGESSEVL